MHSSEPPEVSDADFARLVAAAPFGVTIWQVPGDDPAQIRLVYSNDAASRVSRIAQNERVGRTVGELYPTGLSAPPEHNIPAAWIRVARSGRPETLAAVPYGDENHPPGWFRIHFVPLGRGLVASVYENITDDVSARRELEQFADVASHDLQAPLRTIASFVDLLARALGPVPGKPGRYLGLIRDGVEQMRAYVQGLLAYARTGRDETAEAVDAAEVVDEVRRLLRRAIEAAGATLEASPLPTVVVPRIALLRVVQNLVDNAIKYRDPERPLTVRVDAARREGGWRFTFADNGVGIAPRQQGEAFDLFRRLHAGDIAGAGLGLAICRRVVERWGGRITLESIPGEGTTVSFTVPDGDRFA